MSSVAMGRAARVAVAAVVLILAGCGGTADVSAISGVTPSTVLVTSTIDLGTTETTGGVVVSGWAPPPVPLPSSPEYREKLGPYADMLLRGGVVPWGSEEHASYIVSCLESAGFDATVGSEAGLFTYEVSAGEQTERLRQVQAACEEAVIDSGLVTYPMAASKEELGVRYRADLTIDRCLIDHGFHPSEPPSEEEYIESGGSWDPFGDLSTQEYSDAGEVCTRNLVTILEQMVADGETP
ncbi:MAG: hypothetical protein GXP34_10675 [Actinobacteria bacterium]|nr:hypothetical protein [Actinomycetota bacterium]